MKKLFLTLVAGSVILVGCGEKHEVVKIEEVENQIVEQINSEMFVITEEHEGLIYGESYFGRTVVLEADENIIVGDAIVVTSDSVDNIVYSEDNIINVTYIPENFENVRAEILGGGSNE